MKTAKLILKYLGVAIICYVLVQLEVRCHGFGLFKVFPHDEHQWFNMENASLMLTASRYALILIFLPLGWLNVFLIHKLFKALPKSIWLMSIMVTYHWILLVIIFSALGIPGYSPGVILTIIASMIGAWIGVFQFGKNKEQMRGDLISPA